MRSAKLNATRPGRWGRDIRDACGLHPSGDAQEGVRFTINVTRPFNVLKLARAEIGNLHAEPAAWLTIRVFGETNRRRLGDSFEARRLRQRVSVAGLRRQTLAAADDRIDHVWLRCHTT
jgi:hypothetical protein